MDTAALTEKASAFRAMHDDGDVLVLPNTWDEGSAVLFASLGARAVGLIAEAVAVPVTADMEAGYGPSAADVAATVETLLEAGVVGINLEDSREARRAALQGGGAGRAPRGGTQRGGGRRGPDFAVNARTDVFLFQIGEASGRLDEVLRRAEAYAQAGRAVVPVNATPRLIVQR